MASSFGTRLYRTLNKEEIAKRSDKAPDIFEKLLRSGLSTEEAQNVVNGYTDTGDINIPKFRTMALPADPDAAPDVPSRSTQTPVKMTPTRRGLYAFDQGTGKFTGGELPPEVEEAPTVEHYDSSPKGEDVFVDSKTGAEIRRAPNGMKANRVIKIGESGNSATDSPEYKLAKETYDKYMQALNQKDSKGNRTPISDDLGAAMESAAPILGLNMEDVAPPQEGIVARTAERFGLKDKPQGYRRPVFGARPQPGALPPSGGDKQITKEIAAEFLKRSGGDKEKARSLAKAAGYSF